MRGTFKGLREDTNQEEGGLFRKRAIGRYLWQTQPRELGRPSAPQFPSTKVYTSRLHIPEAEEAREGYKSLCCSGSSPKPLFGFPTGPSEFRKVSGTAGAGPRTQRLFHSKENVSNSADKTTQHKTTPRLCWRNDLLLVTKTQKKKVSLPPGVVW